VLARDVIYRFSIFDTIDARDLRVREIRVSPRAARTRNLSRDGRKNANPHQSEDSRARPGYPDRTQTRTPGLRNSPYRKVSPFPFRFLFFGGFAAPDLLPTAIPNCKFSIRSTDGDHISSERALFADAIRRTRCNYNIALPISSLPTTTTTRLSSESLPIVAPNRARCSDHSTIALGASEFAIPARRSIDRTDNNDGSEKQGSPASPTSTISKNSELSLENRSRRYSQSDKAERPFVVFARFLDRRPILGRAGRESREPSKR